MRTIRPVAEGGDDVGAAQLARAVGKNVGRCRRRRGLSLDELARASGVSRASVSQIEMCKTNPTVGILWKIAVGLRVPLSDLLGGREANRIVLRRANAQRPFRADSRLGTERLVAIGAKPRVEIHELRLAGRSTLALRAHAPGTQEIVIVLSGVLRLRLEGETVDLATGDAMAFEAVRPHVYENPSADEGRYHNIVIYDG